MFHGPDPEPRRARRIAVPAGSCDSHAHVIGPHAAYALSGRPGARPPEAQLTDYLRMLDTLGLERGVLVQPSAYSTDNTLLLDAVAQAPGRLRGIGIVDYERTTPTELRALRDRGVRGMRFNTRGSGPASAGNSPPVALEAVKAMGPLLADAGLHAQFLMLIDSFPDADAQLKDFPVDVVVDHMGYPDPAGGANSKAMDMLVGWLETGRCWVKLSAPYRFSRQDIPYDDVAEIAARLVAAAPERLLWATDWPHSAAFPYDREPARTMPNDGDLLDIFADWCPDPDRQRRILVDNPAALYGFEALGAAAGAAAGGLAGAVD